MGEARTKADQQNKVLHLNPGIKDKRAEANMRHFNRQPSEAEIEDCLEEMRRKLQDCRTFLEEKRKAYEKFDQFETKSEDPYSLRARTMDSRGDHYILQFLKSSERNMPHSARGVGSINELYCRWREVHNYWTDLWEALQRAEVRANVAQQEFLATQAKYGKLGHVASSSSADAGSTSAVARSTSAIADLINAAAESTTAAAESTTAATECTSTVAGSTSLAEALIHAAEGSRCKGADIMQERVAGPTDDEGGGKGEGKAKHDCEPGQTEAAPAREPEKKEPFISPNGERVKRNRDISSAATTGAAAKKSKGNGRFKSESTLENPSAVATSEKALRENHGPSSAESSRDFAERETKDK